MHGNEMQYIQEAFDKNWVAPLGFNVDSFEAEAAEYLGENVHTLALNAGTAALHLAIKLAGVKKGDVVFCSDMTFSATVNPIGFSSKMCFFAFAAAKACSLWQKTGDAIYTASISLRAKRSL